MPTNDIKPALARIAANTSRYKEFYDYYDGRHQLNFASDKFRNKFGRRLQRLRENLCKTVVKAPASRLEIINFLADKKNTENPAWAIWKKSKMPLHAGAIHREAFKTGDAYVICWTDEKGSLRIYPQISQNITVWRNSETDEVERAAKAWRGSDGFYYLNLYYADSIEKYVTKGKADSLPTNPSSFDARHIQGENFPLPNPFNRVPVFHFRFDAEMQDFGTSVLSDVIPFKGDKLTRAKSLAVQAEAGNVKCRKGSWNGEFLSHMHGQPDLPHDDIMDSAGGAFNSTVSEGSSGFGF
jgi:hypothetical protein